MGLNKSKYEQMNPRVTILGSQERELKAWLTSHPDGHERGAVILFRKLNRPVKNLKSSTRYLAVEIIRMEEDWILDSSPTHFTINMRKFPAIYFKCEEEGLELGLVHNHPNGYVDFSERDEINERNIITGLSGCNGKNSCLISLVLAEDNWIGRVRFGKSPITPIPVRHVIVYNDGIDLYGVHSKVGCREALNRQEVAFGKPFNEKLSSLRVAVVGVGGTGSPLATLLARTGVGELILIDGDILDVSNMNRVRGYSAVDIGNKKSKSLAKYIRKLGLGTEVTCIDGYLNESSEAVDALSSADVIFGCTDDVAGRDIMNQAAYYYAQAYIDCGISGSVGQDLNGYPFLQTQKGRVSCLLPEAGSCLRCQKVIDDQRLQNEQKFKDNPELRDLDPETLEREHYISGGGVQSPGIGAFTSAAANNAIATFMNLISRFRSLPSDLRQDNIWIDFIHMSIHSNEPVNDPNCIYCGTREVLLKSENGYRLEMPQLGKIPKNV